MCVDVDVAFKTQNVIEIDLDFYQSKSDNVQWQDRLLAVLTSFCVHNKEDIIYDKASLWYIYESFFTSKESPHSFHHELSSDLSCTWHDLFPFCITHHSEFPTLDQNALDTSHLIICRPNNRESHAGNVSYTQHPFVFLL